MRDKKFENNVTVPQNPKFSDKPLKKGKIKIAKDTESDDEKLTSDKDVRRKRTLFGLTNKPRKKSTSAMSKDKEEDAKSADTVDSKSKKKSKEKKKLKIDEEKNEIKQISDNKLGAKLSFKKLFNRSKKSSSRKNNKNEDEKVTEDADSTAKKNKKKKKFKLFSLKKLKLFKKKNKGNLNSFLHYLSSQHFLRKYLL